MKTCISQPTTTMKKALFSINKNSGEHFYLYTGISGLYGGWMLETGGNPDTLESLEECGGACAGLMSRINAAISDPRTEWEPLTMDDLAYIAGYLEAWGIA